MQQLKDILPQKLPFSIERGSDDIVVNSLQFDSRAVKSGDLFVALRGTELDGHEFIPQATSKGAAAVVCQELPAELDEKVTYLLTADAHHFLGEIASAYYGYPSRNMNVVGVTGTNGKTTVVSLLYGLFNHAGYKSGMLSTIKTIGGNISFESTHTTPDPVQINRTLAEMLAAGCSHCFMEVSSHAVAQKRIAGIEFSGGLFTNITHDHLDYHQTFDNYIKAKKAFFDSLNKDAFAIINADDKRATVMVQNCRARVRSFAIHNMADYRASVIENELSGLKLRIEGQEFYSRLAGYFNAYNILAAFAVAVEAGIEPHQALEGLSLASNVEGRMELVNPEGNLRGIVDYAHTPDALQNVLSTIKDLGQSINKLITVIGCGGNRDKEKRPMMSAIAIKFSDKVILTSDNPRNEDPDQIIEDMMLGIPTKFLHKVLRIRDRKEAIRTACALGEKGDVILVAGKGHEKFQSIKGEKLPFDDKQILVDSLKELNK
jgi:UDP-N-acetylmuramoyl-L-alanyl-D-glutamate--2,6-diaminopimelate ligase